ncbi:hypothetical protein PHYBLDRAFT_170679 [Phycomyces blakesleeanus NRRL 1555(-)]|uniref:Uncharacterized protein n=1 Tax=Phycomyces blakesleeanus (strain ATCC 8743b / DSM 1359 / FGSC 10004 / NBRC 33097 / NRRL 1555) TaxID=763407 RepID=A0A167LXS2_PHYB8|nr:hypothetical protein PHYBLDRAFT_170679 [Phycomyces blakesleeanus NRRL 1555(-)]OAD71309.1 hypothetical protein PHYBLDRAFT_170679 [Phycomyces blakesleeanus NRRL 1555(-)]|eukprot:XP_018289349.1 hypothetical protein PHYBLDRAFT_170679 [Phycomyces blakesleeanus NRRL 1555(-)]
MTFVVYTPQLSEEQTSQLNIGSFLLMNLILTPKQSQIPHQEHTPGSVARRNQCLIMESVLHLIVDRHKYLKSHSSLTVYDVWKACDITLPSWMPEPPTNPSSTLPAIYIHKLPRLVPNYRSASCLR